jgi:uncharacterized Zn-finger protein
MKKKRMNYLLCIVLLVSCFEDCHAMHEDYYSILPKTLILRDSDDQGDLKGNDDQGVQHIAKKAKILCPQPGCDHTFATKHGLHAHQQNHNATLEEQRPHPCRKEGCSERFKQTAHRDRHELTHEGKKPFPCTVQDCTKTFTRDSDRIRHENYVHNGIAKHKCSFCDFMATRISSIKIHERIHTDEKPYECRFCKLAFRHSNQRKSHEEKCVKNLLITINNDVQNKPIDD